MQLKEKRLNKILACIIAALIVPLVLLISLSFSADRDAAWSVMKNEGQPLYSRVVNSLVFDYLLDSRIEGQISLAVFTENEQKHLMDVKSVLHASFEALFFIAVILFSAVWVCLCCCEKGVIPKAMAYGGAASALIPVILCFLPFGFLFTAMHTILFPQGNWQFPAESALIQLYPAQFWESMAFGFFLRVFAIGLAVLAAGIFALYAGRKADAMKARLLRARKRKRIRH